MVIPKDTEVVPERPLNKEQAAAAAHRGAAYLLEAGPGTGKTQTLVARVLSLLEDGFDPRRILLLTFSNKLIDEYQDVNRSRVRLLAALRASTPRRRRRQPASRTSARSSRPRRRGERQDH
ncbi:MAG: UvrD-helicase domain-containing protein [Burkholderiaceae bacterium]